MRLRRFLMQVTKFTKETQRTQRNLHRDLCAFFVTCIRDPRWLNDVYWRFNQKQMASYVKLKQLYIEVRNQTDLSYKAVPFFTNKIREIRVELLKVTSEQGEQVSRDVTDAMRSVIITEREDLNMVPNYPKEVPKYLGRVKTAIVSSLAFASK